MGAARGWSCRGSQEETGRQRDRHALVPSLLWPSPCLLCRGRYHTRTAPCGPRPVKVRPVRPGLCTLQHQPGHHTICLPRPPTAAWDKGWHQPAGTQKGLQAPLSPDAPARPAPQPARAPAGLGPGRFPSAGASRISWRGGQVLSRAHQPCTTPCQPRCQPHAAVPGLAPQG